MLGVVTGSLVWALGWGPLIYPCPYTPYRTPTGHTSEPFKQGEGPFEGTMQLPFNNLRYLVSGLGFGAHKFFMLYRCFQGFYGVEGF